jgi:hypothetical protein
MFFGGQKNEKATLFDCPICQYRTEKVVLYTPLIINNGHQSDALDKVYLTFSSECLRYESNIFICHSILFFLTVTLRC